MRDLREMSIQMFFILKHNEHVLQSKRCQMLIIDQQPLQESIDLHDDLDQL